MVTVLLVLLVVGLALSFFCIELLFVLWDDAEGEVSELRSRLGLPQEGALRGRESRSPEGSGVIRTAVSGFRESRR